MSPHETGDIHMERSRGTSLFERETREAHEKRLREEAMAHANRGRPSQHHLPDERAKTFRVQRAPNTLPSTIITQPKNSLNQPNHEQLLQQRKFVTLTAT